MKKALITAACVAVLPFSVPASVTINFNLGTMYAGETTSSSFFALGGRVNLLALDSGSWSALPALLGKSTLNEVFADLTSSYVPTGATLVGTIGNDNAAGDGVTGGVFNYSYSGNFGAGDELLAVGYSSLTTSSVSPGNGTKGFFFRTESPDDGSITWIAPADGGTYSLYSITTALGGSAPDNAFTSGAGAAGGSGFTTVPEPSTYALLALSGLALGGYAIRRRRRA